MSFKELESLIGRLTYASYGIPLSRHFLDRLRLRLILCSDDTSVFTLTIAEIDDCIIWLKFLLLARKGISMNLLTIRNPTRLCFSDSCPFGLGGWTWSGIAWRLRIPPSSPIYNVSESNNFLEFLAMAVTIWLDILECRRLGLTEQCILSLGDNTSAICWLFKTSRLRPSSIYFESVTFVARTLTMIILESGNVLSSQHLNGHDNIISDLLTYEADDRKLEKYSNHKKFHPLAFDRPSDSLLTARFHNFLPQLIPQHFRLCQLPQEIASFVTQAMQIQELSWIRARNLQMKPTIASGDAGASSAAPNSKVLSTHSSMVYPLRNNTSYSSRFLLCTEELSSIPTDQFVADVRNRWYQRLFKRPLAQLVRRSSTVTGNRPLNSRTGEILSHFSGN